MPYNLGIARHAARCRMAWRRTAAHDRSFRERLVRHIGHLFAVLRCRNARRQMLRAYRAAARTAARRTAAQQKHVNSEKR